MSYSVIDGLVSRLAFCVLCHARDITPVAETAAATDCATLLGGRGATEGGTTADTQAGTVSRDGAADFDDVEGPAG